MPNLEEKLEEMIEELKNKLGTYTNEYGYVHPIPNYEKIIDFFFSHFSSLMESVVEETKQAVVKEIIDGLPEERKGNPEFETNQDFGFNSALSTVRKSLETKYKELKG